MTRGLAPHQMSGDNLVVLRSVLVSLALASVLLPTACAPRSDASPADSARDSSGPGAALDSDDARPRPAMSIAEQTAWLARSDSALRGMIPGMMFGAGNGDRQQVHYCEVEGDDNPPMLMAAVRARPIGHDSVHTDPADDGRPATEVDWHVEFTSVARLTPAPVAGVTAAERAPGVTLDAEAYAAMIGLHVDTLTVGMREQPDVEHRWQVCSLGGDVSATSTGFWMLLDSVPAWVSVERWTPPGASWDRVKALADSVVHNAP